MEQEHLKNQEEHLRCGTASIVGRPNVGKSTLLNKILGEKVAIVSKIPQTTRQRIRGIYNDERGQIIFTDTPGLHLGHDQLDKFMNQAASGAMVDADCVVYLVDVSRRIGTEEENIASQLASVKAPIILALNKVDLRKDRIPEYIALWEKVKGKSVTELKNFTLLPLSAERGLNVAKLVDIVFENVSEGPAFYPRDTVCDIPQKLAVADIIREKLFELMNKEIPHAIGVVVENMEPRRHKTTHINALIVVERESQKEIVIGKKGQVLKQVGTAARKELEELLETKVFLELYVKVQKKWRNDAVFLRDLGCAD